MKQPLTRRQTEIYQSILAYKDFFRDYPTCNEMAAFMGLSLSNVCAMAYKLNGKGWLQDARYGANMRLIPYKK